MSPISSRPSRCKLAGYLKDASAFDEDSDMAQSAAILLTYLGEIYLSPNVLEECDLLQLKDLLPKDKRDRFSAELSHQCAHCSAKENCLAGQIILKHCTGPEDGI